MWNSSFWRKGCGLTGDIWIISDEWKWKWNFEYFEYLESFLNPQFSNDSESERMYIFLSPEDYFRNQEKCEIKLWRAWASDPSRSCRWSPWPSLEVGLDIIVLLVQMTTIVFWSLLNLFLPFSTSRWQVYSLFNNYPCLEIYYRWTMASCNVAAGCTRCMTAETPVVVFQGAIQNNSCS